MRNDKNFPNVVDNGDVLSSQIYKVFIIFLSELNLMKI